MEWNGETLPDPEHRRRDLEKLPKPERIYIRFVHFRRIAKIDKTCEKVPCPKGI